MSAQQEHENAFWNEIVDNHVLSAETVAAYRDGTLEKRWVPLGKIMIREGLVSVRQVMGLVAIQATEPQTRIGDLAVREGFCTPEDIQRCLELQERLSPGPIHLVLRERNISSNRLVNALVGYVHYLEGQLDRRQAQALSIVEQVV